jgi:hypothetical protein
MNLEAMRNFNRAEKVALLKLIIKVAASDNKFTKEEQKTIKDFLKLNKLKITNGYVKEVVAESYDDIVSAFTNKSNTNRAYSIVKEFANSNGINPEFEGKALDQINLVLENKKKALNFSPSNTVKTFFMEFAFLWGKEDLNPKMKNMSAIIFTIIACVFGSFWTSGGLWGFGENTKMCMPQASAVIGGLLIFGSLSFRNFLPRPTNFRNIIFSVANLYLFSIITMHIIGRGWFEKGTTAFIFFGLIILLWLGMKEILGFVFLAFFAFLIYKIIIIDIHLAWRAFPFILSAFIGVSFQSENFFNEFSNITNSFFKKPEIEKELVKESLQLAGKRVSQVTKAAISAGTAVATGMPPKALPGI